MRSTLRGLFPNAWLIARREYFQWIRRRAFIASTLVLAVVVLFLSQAPVGLQALEKGTQAKLVIVVQAKDLAVDAVGDARVIISAYAQTGGAAPFAISG